MTTRLTPRTTVSPAFEPALGKVGKLVIALVLAATVGACSDKTTNPGGGPGAGAAPATFLADKTSAALVPGGSTAINIKNSSGLVRTAGGRDAPGFEAAGCNASIDDPSVASVTCNGLGTAFTIDALNVGKATVTVTNGDGDTIIVSVQVYDPRVLETAELYITFVDSFRTVFKPLDWFACDLAQNDLFYEPVPAPGYHIFGVQLQNGQTPPTYGGLAVRAKAGSNALAFPDSARFIWQTSGGACILEPAVFWDPIPPPGYVPMGSMVDSALWPAGGSDSVLARREWLPVCVRADLTAQAGWQEPTWCDCGSGHPTDLGAFTIGLGTLGYTSAVMPVGTMIAKIGWSGPSAHPAMNVLRVDLPIVAEGPGQSYFPTLTGFDEPPETTPPLAAYQMLIPYTMIVDELKSPEQRASETPLYLLERQVFYKRLNHFYNQGGLINDAPVTITSGVEQSQSQTFWQSTGISITATAGIEIKGLSASVSTTISQEFGYSTTSSLTQLNYTSHTITMRTQPDHATAVWQKYTRFVLYRHAGVIQEPVAAWEFGIDSYVLDEYPD